MPVAPVRKAKRNDDEALVARFESATNGLRTQVARAVSVTDPSYENYAPLSYWRERWSDRKVQQRFIEKFLKVRDAFDENKLVPFVLTDLQRELHLKAGSKVAVAKGRGAMSTRYWLALKFAKAVVMSGTRLRIIPQDPDTEDELFDTIKTFYENLPDQLRPATKYNSKELLHFHDAEKGVTDSTITTLSIPPGHEAKGRGQSMTDLIISELPHWRCDQKKAVRSLLQSLRGNWVVTESTAQGLEEHYAIYQQGKRGEAGWQSFFFGWWWTRSYRLEGATFGLTSDGTGVTLDYVDKSIAGALTARELGIAKVIFRHLRKFRYVEKGSTWLDAQVAEFIAWRRHKIAEIGERMFSVEYPENDRDCFEQSGRPLVAAEYLKVTCRAATEPVEGRSYAIGVDTSLGLANGDPYAIQVVDLTTGRQVFEEIGKLQPDVLAYRVSELCDLWNGATLVIERNNSGIATINKLLELGYEDYLYKYIDAKTQRQIEDNKKDFYEAVSDAQWGFPTTTETKPQLGIALEKALRTGELGLSSEAFCEECKTVAWKDDKTWAAQGDGHDDRVIALALIAFAFFNEAGMRRGFIGVLPESGEFCA